MASFATTFPVDGAQDASSFLEFVGAESGGVDENSCSTELYDSYGTEYDYDADDNEIVYAYGIVDDNVEEYLDCLAAFAPDDVGDFDWDFPAPAPAGAVAPPPARDGRAKASLRKSRSLGLSFFHALIPDP